MSKFLLFALFVLGMATAVPAQEKILQVRNVRPDSVYARLDSFILNKPAILLRKEQRIRLLREECESSPASFRINLRLFGEYKSYLYDSAYVYANRLLDIAEAEANPTHVVEAKAAVMFCLISSGLFKEASDVASSISLDGVDRDGKITYYELMARYYFDLSDYNRNEAFYNRYIRMGCAFSDSLLSLLPPDSKESVYTTAQRQMKLREYPDAVQSFEKYLLMSDDVHEHAIALSCLSYIHKSMGDHDKSFHYAVRAAIDDIRGAVTETTALCSLAVLLYEEGDVLRANRYIGLALDDAMFYNARHRKIEIGSVLPMIEETRYRQLEESRNTLRWAFRLIVVLLILMIAAIVVICLQMKRVHATRRMAEERNILLEHLNAKLEETGNIKDEFIGMSFYLNSECITRIENLYKTVNRKIAARQTDDLKSMFKESDLKEEREKMYRSFDNAFLRLFPSFIKEFDTLAPNGEKQTDGEPPVALTPEMRIFALIRLGISEVDRIAKFLNYSVHTINTYKTRVKNRSSIPNDKFEARIMEIRSGR